MGTSISLPCPDGRRLFGRTLDWVEHFGEKLLPVPRGFRFEYGRRCGDSALPADNLYAMIGMGNDAGGYPLYADALNERGLCMAGLRFAQGAHSHPIDTPLPTDAVRHTEVRANLKIDITATGSVLFFALEIKW